MKNWKQFTFMAIIAIVGIIIDFMACNNDNETTHVHQWGAWSTTKDATCTDEGEETRVCTLDATHKEAKPIAIDPNAHLWGNWTITTPATATADGVETRICEHNSVHKDTRPIERTEPAKKDFTVSFDFQNQTDPSFRYDVAIVDKRTACGSADLENVKVGSKDIITIIEEAIMGAFNSGTGPSGSAMRGRFREVFNITGGITIYVENTATAYKMKATDTQSIYFHIDYLKSNPEDIEQNIVSAVNAMADSYSWATLPYNAE
jgi:hypothetical protein